MVNGPRRHDDWSMFFHLEALSAAGRDAVRRRESMRRDDAGFEELWRLRPDGHLAARRGNRQLGEPEWTLTIHGLELLAILVALDLFTERTLERAGYRIKPSRSARATAPALSETSHFA
jgi:hypothetical protein